MVIRILSWAFVASACWIMSPIHAAENSALDRLGELREKLLKVGTVVEQQAVATSMTNLLGIGEYKDSDITNNKQTHQSYGIRQAPAATPIEKTLILYAISYLSQLGLQDESCHNIIEAQLESAHKAAIESWKQTHVQLVHIAYEFFKDHKQVKPGTSAGQKEKALVTNLLQTPSFKKYYGANEQTAGAVVQYFEGLFGSISLDRLFATQTDKTYNLGEVSVPSGATVNLRKAASKIKVRDPNEVAVLNLLSQIQAVQARLNFVDPEEAEQEKKKKQKERKKQEITDAATLGKAPEYGNLIEELKAVLESLKRKKNGDGDSTVSLHID